MYTTIIVFVSVLFIFYSLLIVHVGKETIPGNYELLKLIVIIVCVFKPIVEINLISNRYVTKGVNRHLHLPSSRYQEFMAAGADSM